VFLLCLYPVSVSVVVGAAVLVAGGSAGVCPALGARVPRARAVLWWWWGQEGVVYV